MPFDTNALQIFSVPRRMHDLLVISKTCLVWPLFPVRDQISSNWILSNVVPLFVNCFRCSKETVKAARLPSPFSARIV